jgi:hypothetical protein
MFILYDKPKAIKNIILKYLQFNNKNNPCGTII